MIYDGRATRLSFTDFRCPFMLGLIPLTCYIAHPQYTAHSCLTLSLPEGVNLPLDNLPSFRLTQGDPHVC